MSDEAVFKKWFKIACAPERLEETCGTPTPWEDDFNYGMLMGLFPPDGAGLERICAGYEHGDEVLVRLREVYAECAEAGDDMPSEFKMSPVAAESQEAVEELLLAHAAGILAAARSVDSDDGIQCAGDPPKLVRVEGEDDVEWSEDDGFLNGEMWDAVEDKFGPAGEARSRNHLILLTEALYQWAWDDYAVANWVLWPIYRGESGLQDPRRPAYELYKRGVKHAYAEPGVIRYWFEGAS